MMTPVCEPGSWLLTWPMRWPPLMSHDSNASPFTLYSVTMLLTDEAVLLLPAVSAGDAVEEEDVLPAAAAKRILSATTLLFWTGNWVGCCCDWAVDDAEDEAAWRG